MKSTAKYLWLALATIAFSTPAFAQSYSFSDSQVQQTGYQQQSGPYYTRHRIQDELPAPGMQDPQLPGGNSSPPTGLPTPAPRNVTGSPSRNVPPMGTGVDPQTLPMESRSVPMPRVEMAPSPSPYAAPSTNLSDMSAPMMSPPTMNLNSGGPGYSQPMMMPAPYQDAPCCPDHAVPSQSAYAPVINAPMNFSSGNEMGSVLMQPASQSMTMSDDCGCGSDCGGSCESMGLGNGRLGLGNLNGASIGHGLGSNVGSFRSLFEGGPMYAFFDFGGFFSESESRFSGTGLSPVAANPFGHKDSFLFGAGLGRYINNDLRIDLSARYRYVELEDQMPGANGFRYLADGGDDVWTGMLTARHNLPGVHPCIKPYLSVGAGFALHRAQASNLFVTPAVQGVRQPHTNEEFTEFAWAVGGGVAFKMTSHMFFDVDYQYINMGDAATGPAPGGRSILFDDLTANEVAFRLRFNF